VIRRAVATTAAAVAAVSLLAAVAVASPTTDGVLRVHRLILPTPPLAHDLTVDESEYEVVPSESVVGAGRVTFEAYDRGQDAHNLTLQGPVTASGDGKIRGQVYMQPGASATIVARLQPGRYKLYCSLFAGTPQSHEMLGMLSYITVR
jgi:plastocyanin